MKICRWSSILFLPRLGIMNLSVELGQNWSAARLMLVLDNHMALIKEP